MIGGIEENIERNFIIQKRNSRPVMGKKMEVEKSAKFFSHDAELWQLPRRKLLPSLYRYNISPPAFIAPVLQAPLFSSKSLDSIVCSQVSFVVVDSSL